MINPLLDIDSVDFTDSDDISGFVSLLCHESNGMGMFMAGFQPTPDSSQLRQTAGLMAYRLSAYLPEVSPSDSLKIVHSYDLAHRLAYNVSGNPDLVNKCVLGTFDAMIHGDKTVDEYSMYREIDSKVHQKDRLYLDKPLTWNCLSTERWLRSIDDTAHPEYDTVNRVSILLGADLFVYVGSRQDKYKRSLFEKYRHVLDRHDTENYQTLQAVNQFLNASVRYLTPHDAQKYQSSIKREILTHPQTNRFVKARLVGWK